MLKAIKSFPISVYTVLFGAFIIKTIYYMLWPFFAVVFDKQFGLSIIATGSIIASGVLLSIVCSIFGGIVSDNIGRKPILLFSLIILLLSSLLLIFVQNFSSYLILLYCVAIGKGLTDTIFKTIISSDIKDIEVKKQAFYLLYYCVNIGGSIGPILGVMFTLHYPQLTFIVLFLIFFIFLALCIFIFKNEIPIKNENKYSFFDSINIVKKDKPFILLILAFVLIMLVYDQFDSTLVQYFSHENSSQLIALIGVLMVINCLTVLVFQFPLLGLISKFSDNTKIYIGIFLFAISQIIFALTPPLLFSGWIAATIVLTFGEIILFSIINIQIDKISPDNLKGAYFGVANLYKLGLFLAPLVGSILLDVFGRTILFLIMLLICFFIFLIYRKAISTIKY